MKSSTFELGLSCPISLAFSLTFFNIVDPDLQQDLIHLAAVCSSGPCITKTGAPNDGFLLHALKRCFRLSGVLLKLGRLILGCAIKCLSVRCF